MSYADRAVLPQEEFAKRVRLQVLARMAPHKVRIPSGWQPKTAFDRHLAELLKGSAR